MHWSDDAILLSARKFAEHGAVITLFSREHGLYSGMHKTALTKSNRGICQPGNRVQATWRARLSEHLGTLSCELHRAYAALLMQERECLMALNAVCALIPLAMRERDPHPVLFDITAHLLECMAQGEQWLTAYVGFELCLLREAGFGLDLSQCAATGNRDELIYVSPKSGCAVSADAGAPYRDKLLRLPAFMLHEAPITPRDIADGFALTAYFLQHWLLGPHHQTMPATRDALATRFSIGELA